MIGCLYVRSYKTFFVYISNKKSVIQEADAMGLFGKKKKTQAENEGAEKKKERDEIANMPLKELLMNDALATLTPGQDYHKLDYTMCEFGYLYLIEGHGIEALFKMRTDVGTFYFAVQGKTLRCLLFNEELFRQTTAGFLSLHGNPE